jgi:hypothetical protein
MLNRMRDFEHVCLFFGFSVFWFVYLCCLLRQQGLLRLAIPFLGAVS